jgi:homopolymeric O-antigen transport system permease protein
MAWLRLRRSESSEVTALGEQAAVTIRARRASAWLDLPELWSYRELLWFLIWRDLKVRYKQTALGVLWAVLQPLLLMAVFTLALGRIGNLGSGGVPYPLFAFVGLAPWTLFAQSLIGSSVSLVESSNLVQKVYFPRLLLPLASVASYVLDFGMGMVLLVALLAVAGIHLSTVALWVVPFTGLALLSAVGAGAWLSAVNVRYRDVRYAVPFLVQVWLFASPVAYASALIPPEWQTIYHLNPMAAVIDGFRWALLGLSEPPIASLAISALGSAVMFVGGLYYFRRVERTFADVI